MLIFEFESFKPSIFKTTKYNFNVFLLFFLLVMSIQCKNGDMLCRFNIKSTIRSSYDVIEIDNYVILSSLQNLHFREYSIFVYRFGLIVNELGF